MGTNLGTSRGPGGKRIMTELQLLKGKSERKRKLRGKKNLSGILSGISPRLERGLQKIHQERRGNFENPEKKENGRRRRKWQHKTNWVKQKSI